MKCHINDGSCPVSVLLLYVAEISTLLVVQNNHYYHDHTDWLDNGPSAEPDPTEAEFFAVVHCRFQQNTQPPNLISTLQRTSLHSPSTKHFSPPGFTVIMSSLPTSFPLSCSYLLLKCHFFALAQRSKIECLSISLPNLTFSQIYISHSSIHCSPQLET
jgi:hypothetical protein